MKVFITFGAGGQNYIDAGKRLIKQAKSTGYFDKTIFDLKRWIPSSGTPSDSSQLPEDPIFRPEVWLFSESPSRFVVSIKKEDKNKFESLFLENSYKVGSVTNDRKIRIYKNIKRNKLLIDLTIEKCIQAWKKHEL